MELKRRDILKALAVASAAGPLTACESIYSEVGRNLGQKIPDKLSSAKSAKISDSFHLLSRAAYGPWPGDIERLNELGSKNWLEEQLNPEKIDDTACNIRARRFETIQLPEGACYDFKKESLRKDIVRHTLLRAVYSKRQLLEVMVEFWSDHFNISLDKGDCIYFKAADDRQVIRKHALGKFKDLIRASALSPAMLVYLDGKENKKGKKEDIPNENYARELLELHTLGVHGGYSQKDVYETARCLTGWRLHDGWQRGKVYFDEKMHDNGEKTVLGKTIPAGGAEKDLDQIVELVCNHKSTSNFIASKMTAHFVEGRQPALVEKVAAIFRSSGGDIKAMLREILLSEEFAADKGSKLKRPFRFLVGTLRSLAADTHAHDELIEYLSRMGQAPFQYPTPDGYPEDQQFWLGTLLWRWNFAIAACCSQLDSVKIDLDKLISSLGLKEAGKRELQEFFAHFVGRLPEADELASLQEFISEKPAKESTHRAVLAALIISSPAFQNY